LKLWFACTQLCVIFNSWMEAPSCHQLLVNSKVEWYLGLGIREVKQLPHGVDHSLPFGIKFQNEWSYNSTAL